MITTEPDVIFTYGTLRPGLGNRTIAHEFRATATHIGHATFQGKLYAIDWYPAAIDSAKSEDIVTGDLFQIGRNSDFFSKLDTYEGCSDDCSKPHEYIRTIRNVTRDGQLVPAWIYLFNWTITDQVEIESGDFADHLAFLRP